MRRPARLLALTLMACLQTSLAAAVGTPAGTLIQSQAMVSYTQAGQNMTTASNLLSLPVNEVLDFTLVWQDAAAVPVYAGDTNAALTFRLQNTGNGHETFLLTVINALAGDDFDPLSPAVHVDTNSNGYYDPLQDDLYIEGINDPELAADQPLTIFLVGVVPPDLATGDRGDLKLAVGSEAGYGVPGTVVYGQGDGGTDAIIGLTGGFTDAVGSLEVAAVQVNLFKSAMVTDGTGRTVTGSEVDETSTITYTITVTVSGSGIARDVRVTDPIPPGTVYRLGTLVLNDTPLSDAADSDAGDVADQLEGAVTIALGDMTADTPTQRISFQVALE